MSKVFLTNGKELQTAGSKETVFHPGKVKEMKRREVVYMYLAEYPGINIILYNKAVDKRDSDILHDEFFYSINRSDFYIGTEVCDILIVRMQDLHEITVGVGVIFSEHQPVAVEFLKIDCFSCKRMHRRTDADRFGFEEFHAFIFVRGTVDICDAEMDTAALKLHEQRIRLSKVHADFLVGIAPEVFGYHVGDQRLTRGCQCADPDLFSLLGTGLQAVCNLLGIGFDGLGKCTQQLSMLGEMQTAFFIVVKQLGPMVLFQVLNVLGHRRLCDVKNTGRLCIVPGLAQDKKCF